MSVDARNPVRLNRESEKRKEIGDKRTKWKDWSPLISFDHDERAFSDDIRHTP